MVSLTAHEDCKAHEMFKFLDASAMMPSSSESVFALGWGSNEGCYITLGPNEYRCHVEGDEAIELFKKAVAHYTSL